MVFDFVDNASQYNMPYSMHRLFRLKEYKPGALVLGTKQQKTAEQDLYNRGERPEALIDWPVDALDYELVDIFNWQEEAAGMISQMEFVRRVDVQTETIERYVRDGLLVPDLVVPMSEYRTFKYFKEETLQKYAEQYGWTLIDDSNRKDLFLEMVRQMDMSYSYKPVLLKAVLLYADDKGRVKLSDIVTYFREFYEARRAAGLVVEKANSIYAKGGYTDAQAQRIELESVPKASRRVAELKREINGLGTINVGAIDEFERVNGRYTYLTDQRNDVEKAKGELTGIIGEITSQMTDIFGQQFKLLSDSFEQTFVELFGGGQAKLELEDPEHILDCGIEIKAQPPGKALKTISLLSGGEKAFVAIALYFAILKVHPTPFCIMDEIEAALDEANVVRTARYMRTLADKTQFIVITHRRGTMEAADVLYGVTMQEQGVSKILTINLNDMAKELEIQ